MFRGHREVVDADLADYFGSIPHAELLKSVARRIVDGEVLRLIKLRLKTPIEERDADGKRRLTGGKRSRYGTPQSGVVSPLLANLYMNQFLKHWRYTGCGEASGRKSSRMPTTLSPSTAATMHTADITFPNLRSGRLACSAMPSTMLGRSCRECGRRRSGIRTAWRTFR